MAEVAYKPLDKTIPSQIQPQQKIDIPSYPDKGTTFAGYSKTLYSGNTYQLNPQTAEDITWSGTFTGGELTITLASPFTPARDFYVNKIIMHFYHTGGGTGGSYIGLFAGGVRKFNVMEDMTVTYNRYDFDFSIPLLFKKGELPYMEFSSVRTVDDKITITFFGWTE